jgi:glycosyltransferase involved in cell wall biosynthesis
MKFSVTIPAYKRLFLAEAIESILQQTYNDFELIIVDDCSPEDLKSVVDSFTDPRIRYYRNRKNCGAIDVVDNWNICLSYCTGDYVICMGDDDKLLPCCLEEYNKLIQQNPGIGIVHGWTEIIDEQSSVVKLTAKRCAYESAISLMWHRWNVYNNQFIGDFCFNTSKLKENGGFFKLPLAWASDDISAVIMASDKGIVNSDVLVFQYRTNSQTITNSGNCKVKMEAIIEEEDWYKSYLDSARINSREDYLYCDMLKKQLNSHFRAKRVDTLIQEFRKSKYKIFFWGKNKKKYNLFYKDLIVAFIKAMF